MNYKELIRKAKSLDLKSVYLFYGEEHYLIDHTLNTIKEIYIDEAFEPLNYLVMEGKNLNFEAILNACETLPFMSDKKIVVIKDHPLFKSNKDVIIGDKNIEDYKNELVDYLDKLEDYLCLIFLEKTTNIRKSNALYKKIAKVGDVIEFKKLRGQDLNNWVENSFKKYNKSILKSDINYFITYSAYFDPNQEKNLYDLENEIIKICNYLRDEERVNRKILDLIMTKPLDMNVFNLLNSISQKDGRNAIILFNEMYMSNQPVLFILHMIIRQIRNMFNYKVLRAKGYTDMDAYEKMKLSKFEYQKVSQQSNNFTISQLESALKFCLQADRNIKFSLVEDRLALEILIANLCYKI
ncbi:DNA polymerase III delta subunit [Keratinibaculum paraultunense]|uniref:DNA polymerase III subunit delta n=1 Tax=Keratinibaculum paraultunense TaxID=1278232 RepID=A0A4R3KZF0_9FIRM|nr:DNA polymerase III subunit delta [Keratinibaculum paraultunense]QQY80451.1 DNA polymerase III subunit delta [Keratinibaculum paraultunense]TCS91169.1 DNA polymerase III delta subunit [Keratinibaculum paraultunense]